MEGKISFDGILQIKRVGEFKNMLCQNDPTFFCSDECVAFGDPKTIVNGTVDLGTCNKTLMFDDFQISVRY